ncbi:MAG TPA: GreA/GreB family elongation factor [Thermoanaerobaculia bacterium]|nr:GreA/GreB family elongation factor [Thermoanaerobaculia bacterium]
MKLIQEVEPLIEQGHFEEVESRWIARMEEDPSDAAGFLAVAKRLRKANERSRSDTLLELFADALRERELWPERLQVLREIGRLARRPSTLREPLREALDKSYGHLPSYEKVLRAVNFADEKANPVELTDKAESWLRFEEGEVFFMSGRGVGVVTELNPELGICRLDFENEKRVAVPLGAAPKYLEPMGRDFLLRRKIDDPDGLQEEVLADPARALEEVLRGFGRAMTAAEIKDAMTGIVPAGRWSTWWTSARKHPQIVVSGGGARASYSWKASAEAAEEAIRKKFARAPLRQKLEIAKKESARNEELADSFASVLAAEAERIHQTDPATAWEILTILEKLPGRHSSDLDPDGLLLGPRTARVLAAIPDRALRERALEIVRLRHDQWQQVFAEIFFLEEDPRVLTLIADALEREGANDIRSRLIDETLRFPRRRTHAFAWYCRVLQETEPLPQRADYALVFQMLDVLSSEEAAAVRPRLKEMFDRGGLVLRVVMGRDQPDEAERLRETIDRFGMIESYRRDLIKSAITMKYAQLRDAEAEPILTTVESAAAKRAEYENLRTVEIPANLKAIQEAREMGDLRENFEYKAARQRQEYLSARLSALQSELSRIRTLDPSEIDPSQIRVGTRVILRNGDLERVVSILGPWESSPEHGIYSYESDAAKALIGKRPGEMVSFLGTDYVVETIERWR